MSKQNYTVELRNEETNDTKTVRVLCNPNQLLGTVHQRHPGWLIVRYY